MGKSFLFARYGSCWPRIQYEWNNMTPTQCLGQYVKKHLQSILCLKLDSGFTWWGAQDWVLTPSQHMQMLMWLPLAECAWDALWTKLHFSFFSCWLNSGTSLAVPTVTLLWCTLPASSPKHCLLLVSISCIFLGCQAKPKGKGCGKGTFSWDPWVALVLGLRLFCVVTQVL